MSNCGQPKSGRVLLLLAAVLGIPILQAQEAATQGLVDFTPPTMDGEIVKPEYPQEQMLSDSEGYVDIHFMVDVDGNAFEPVVARSVGSGAFDEEALKALARTRFIPAQRQGEPITGAGSFRYHFTMRDSAGGTRRFVTRYDRFMEALEGGDREEIEEALQAMEAFVTRNHHENAFTYFARYNHAQLFGNAREQMEFLHGALSYADSVEDRVYIAEEDQPALWRELLSLQARNQFFPAALNTWAIMQARGDEEGMAAFAPVVEAINKVKTDDTEYAIPFIIPESGILWHNLFKRRFFISGGEGKVVEMGLYCDTAFTALQLDRDLDYELPEAWGDCGARISGDAGASFYLVQH